VLLTEESLLKLPLQKLAEGKFPMSTDGSNTDHSLSSPSHQSRQSQTDGTLSINDEDFPDFCDQCTHCSTTIQKVIEQHKQTEEVLMTAVNRQISSFFLSRRGKKCEPSASHVHHTHNEHDTFEAEEIGKRRKNILQIKQRERQQNILQ
jgi:hypothetical protein